MELPIYPNLVIHLSINSGVSKKALNLFNDNYISNKALIDIGNSYKLAANINNKLIIGNTLAGVN